MYAVFVVLFVVCAPSSRPPDPISYAAEVPLNGVDISANSLLEPIMQANIDYLLTSFDVNHMLYPFRVRAGKFAPPGKRQQIGFWDTDLKGSNAGRFLMGAGNALRWIQNQALRSMLNAVVDGIDECKNSSNGYSLAFDPNGFMHSEQGDYGRSWFTQGLIEAGKSGNSKVWPLLRSLYDWFNNPDKNPYLPYLYDGISNAEQGQIASTRVYLETPVGTFDDSQVAQDTYRDDFWLRQLIARDSTGISMYHMPDPNHPHCYEITAFLSMFDNYRATHNVTWLEAAQGGWDLIRRDFLHIDGSSSLTEGAPDIDPVTGVASDWKAKTYRISPGTGTGETCCTVFWIKLNQRFHLLSPDNEQHTAQIETAIFNALLRQMAFRSNTTQTSGRRRASPPYTSHKGTPMQRSMAAASQLQADEDPALPPGIRYHAVMEGVIDSPNNINTCCEGQGTRAFGSLPEYIYSIVNAKDTKLQFGVATGLYVNLFASSSLDLNVSVVSSVWSTVTRPAVPVSKTLPMQYKPQSASPVPQQLIVPPMSWQRVSTDGWYPGSYCEGGNVTPVDTPCPENVTTLEQCKSLCLHSTHPNMCMGLTWMPAPSPPPPPPPAHCNNDCQMIALPASSGTGAFHSGLFNESQAASVTSLQDCLHACLRDQACVQITWADRLVDPCVMYQTIYEAMETIAGAEGWVKCKSGSKESSCAPITPGGPPVQRPTSACTLFRAIDQSVQQNRQVGMEQWLVLGRRNNVQHDYPSFVNEAGSREVGTTRLVERDETYIPIKFTMRTDFPFSGKVHMQISWRSKHESKVAFMLKIRVPSWLPAPLTMYVNGIPHSAEPSKYLALNRAWSQGDSVSFTLPTVYRLSQYRGVDQVKGFEGKRFALLVGPIVLACVGPMNVSSAIVLPVPPANVNSWLLPDTRGLHFRIKGVGNMKFMPLWDVPDGASFTVYPIFAGHPETELFV